MNEIDAILLVVEDEPITRTQLAGHFQREGYTVLTRENADHVEETIKEQNVDICLVDINLPGKDGLTLTREIRSRSDVGIILVTGKDEQIDRIVGLESGADDYVTKPFDPRELLSRVKNLLWRLRAQQKAERTGYPASLCELDPELEQTGANDTGRCHPTTFCRRVSFTARINRQCRGSVEQRPTHE